MFPQLQKQGKYSQKKQARVEGLSNIDRKSYRKLLNNAFYATLCC
jgi:hypothetical protein